MNLQDYARAVREQWVVAVIGLVLCVGAAVAAYIVRPAEYTAELTMYVSSLGAESTNALQGAQLSQQRVSSYVELVSSRRVSEEVISELGLALSPDDLRGRITADSTLESVLIDVSVVDESPQQAAEVANSVGDVFTALVDELERPIEVGAAPAVAVRVVQPAVAPESPSSTSLSVTVALGVLAGLVAGVSAALVRNALDRSIRSPEELRAAAGAPNIGTIAHDSKVPKRPLTVHEDPQSPRSEAFRQLRTNLQFVDIDNPRKVIVMTSSLPAEGKSTTIVNLAIALASAGGRVLLIDADLRRPRLSDLLGLDSSVGLTTVLAGRAGVRTATQSWGGMLDVLASGALPPNPSELLASKQMAALLNELRRNYDTILIDSPPLLPVTDAAAIAPAADGAILVCRFKSTTRGQVQAAAEALSAVGSPVLGTVLSMVPSSGPRAYAQYNSYYRTVEPSGQGEAAVQPRPASSSGRGT